MTRPVLLAVDDEPAAAALVAEELRKRYGTDYRVVCERSARAALLALEAARDSGEPVALLLADLSMPEMTGLDFLCRAHGLHPGASRVLMFDWGDRTAAGSTLPAWTLGQLDDWIPKPIGPADEHFHQGVSAFLYGWAQQHRPGMEMVQVVARRTSARSHEIRDVLSRNSVRYGFHEPDSATGRALLERTPVTGAEETLPVLVTFDGQVLVDPSNADIARAFGIPTSADTGTYDVVIIGAGPAGLAAAVYGASEGLRAAVLEQEAIGGQAGSSSLIRNYLGFPRGVSGTELAIRAVQQAGMFGAEIVYGRATGITAAGVERAVTLADGGRISARAVLIATGVSYRRLGIPSLEARIGVGVFYGAAASEAPAMRDEEVYVVGGANSAGQAALHLAKYASRVTLLVRAPSLQATMSDYLIRQITAADTIDVRQRTEVVEATGEGRLTGLVLRDRESGVISTVPAAALFVLIGAEPHTGWLPTEIQRDRHGYVRTGTEVTTSTLHRPPLPFETSMPGIFAVGDVRHGSVKRVASSVGEGSVAIQQVHDYLAPPGF
ncbi:MAG TPA: FAD-dependent oxidoreductase [Mycobacteriales bacterium]|nr:FAD-dependent oxidoreductase [Mycobacteriales bacterium]